MRDADLRFGIPSQLSIIVEMPRPFGGGWDWGMGDGARLKAGLSEDLCVSHQSSCLLTTGSVA